MAETQVQLFSRVTRIVQEINKQELPCSWWPTLIVLVSDSVSIGVVGTKIWDSREDDISDEGIREKILHELSCMKSGFSELYFAAKNVFEKEKKR